jgi:hypothetical protein
MEFVANIPPQEGDANKNLQTTLLQVYITNVPVRLDYQAQTIFMHL